MRKKVPPRLIVFLVLVLAGILLWLLGQEFISFDSIQAHRSGLALFVETNYTLALLIFSAVYTISAAIAFPLGGVFVMLAGFLFGPVVGTIVAVLAATLGGFIVFLITRYLLQDWIQEHFGAVLRPIENEIAMHPAAYLLMLRLSPVVPYIIINTAPALIRVSPLTFIWTSIVGLLPGAFVFALVGGQLGRITSTGDIFTPGLILVLVLLGVVSVIPLLYKKVERRFKENISTKEI